MRPAVLALLLAAASALAEDITTTTARQVTETNKTTRQVTETNKTTGQVRETAAKRFEDYITVCRGYVQDPLKGKGEVSHAEPVKGITSTFSTISQNSSTTIPLQPFCVKYGYDFVAIPEKPCDDGKWMVYGSCRSLAFDQNISQVTGTASTATTRFPFCSGACGGLIGVPDKPCGEGQKRIRGRCRNVIRVQLTKYRQEWANSYAWITVPDHPCGQGQRWIYDHCEDVYDIEELQGKAGPAEESPDRDELLQLFNHILDKGFYKTLFDYECTVYCSRIHWNAAG